MSWNDMIGNESVVRHFQRLFANRTMPSTFLLVGPEGIGKRMFAEGLAEALLCRNRPADQLTACGHCASCLQVKSKNDPDVLRVERPKDRNVISVEQISGSKDKSITGLNRDLRVRAQTGSRKIAIIDDADYIQMEAANALLKTLEEPPPGAVILMLGTSSQRQLPTILSRCQIVRFDPLTAEQVATILRRMDDLEINPEELLELAAASMGSVKVARLLANPEVADFRKLLLEQLGTLDPAADGFPKSCVRFAESISKDTSQRRERLYLLNDFAIEFYHQLCRRVSGQDIVGDTAMKNQVALAASAWNAGLGQIGKSIDRLCDFQKQIEGYANFNNACDLLFRDLTRLSAGQPSVSVV